MPLAFAPLLALSDNDILPLLLTIFSLGAGIAITAIVASQWRATREAAFNARLKQIMIERGMSADEIERVILANPASDAEKKEWEGMAQLFHGPRKAS